jgi:hypothetical protein
MKLKPLFAATALLLCTPVLKAQWITFPVVFHVLYDNAPSNLPDSVLQHQLDVLNEDLNATNPDIVNVPAVWQPLIGSMNISLVLANLDPQGNSTTGIERRQVSNNNMSPAAAHSFAQGGLDPWPDTSYLNIWIYDMQGLLSFAPFPDTNQSTLQYIDIDWIVTGRNDPNQQAPYNKGRCGTHAIGHFFGLYHIWGDDAGTCAGSDNIADTPNQADETFGDPGVGTVITDACTNSAPGIMWMNYMDYTDDAGMCFFTQGQITGMTNAINLYYAKFGNPSGISDNASEDDSHYSVFPSPSASGIFQVNRVDYNTRTSVEVYDLQGRMILAPEYFENGSTTMQVNLSTFENGTYTFVIRTETSAETKRVAIAK